jgi:hypothetical protein
VSTATAIKKTSREKPSPEKPPAKVESGKAAFPPSPIPIGDGSSLRSAAGDVGQSAQLDTQSADDERFPFLTAAQLSSGRFTTRYLIPGILAAAQPGGIFGAFKTLKTSITADLLISLASGTPFLGQFAVPEPGRTLFLSGESGLDALQSIALRICAARGLTLESLDNFELSPKLPNLDSRDDLAALRRIVARKKPACIAIDPAYLSIPGEDARNLFAMGSLLRPLAELCNEFGCAVLIAHHCKRTRVVPGDPATVDDIAWSGFAEFSAQWLLLARRRRYDPDAGHHELWFSTGGRAGHHGLWALEVFEGTPDDPRGRVWQPVVRRVRSAALQSEVQHAEASEDRRARRSQVVFERDRHRLVKTMLDAQRPVTARWLRDTLRVNGLRVQQLLTSLLKDGLLTSATYHSGYRTEIGYQASDGLKAWMKGDAGGAASTTPPADQNLSSGSGHIVSLGS